MKVSAMASPYQIYQALLGIPWEIAGKYRAERTQITFSPVSSSGMRLADRGLLKAEKRQGRRPAVFLKPVFIW